jgi:ketosteroid isomerase-like protein
MSEENVDQARRGYDALNRRDLDAFLALMDPEVEFTTRFAQMEGGSQYRGHDGVREWWEDLLAIFPDFRVEVLEVRDLGDLAVAIREFVATASTAMCRSRRRCGARPSFVTARWSGGRPAGPRPKPSKRPGCGSRRCRRRTSRSSGERSSFLRRASGEAITVCVR